MIELSKLGVLRDRGYGLVAFCETRDCGRYAPLDLEVLVARFGADFDVVAGDARLLASLKCSECGGRRLSVQLKPPTKPMMG